MARDEEAMDRLEQEVRDELGIKNVGPNMSTHEAGMIGGYMVKRLIERGEQSEDNGGMEEEEEGNEMEEM